MGYRDEKFEELVRKLNEFEGCAIIVDLNLGGCLRKTERVTDLSELGGVPYEVVGFECPKCGNIIYYENHVNDAETCDWTVCPLCNKLILREYKTND